MSARHFATPRQALLHTSRPGTFAEADLAHYQASWCNPEPSPE
jgi:hypothetical protein